MVVLDLALARNVAATCSQETRVCSADLSPDRQLFGSAASLLGLVACVHFKALLGVGLVVLRILPGMQSPRPDRHSQREHACVGRVLEVLGGRGAAKLAVGAGTRRDGTGVCLIHEHEAVLEDHGHPAIVR